MGIRTNVLPMFPRQSENVSRYVHVTRGRDEGRNERNWRRSGVRLTHLLFCGLTGLLAVQWICQIALQSIGNVGHAGDGPKFVPRAPTIVAFSLALALMPSYLDYKSATLPDEFDETHYGPDEVDEEEEDEENAASEAAKRKMAGRALSNANNKTKSTVSSVGSSSIVSETIEAMEKKQKILEKSIVTLARQQKELQMTVAGTSPQEQMYQQQQQPEQYSMSASGSGDFFVNESMEFGGGGYGNDESRLEM